MKRYIGIDVHSSSCTLGVLSEKGRKLNSMVVETNGKALVDTLQTVPGELHVVMEEGTMSEWLFEVLRPHVKELVVVGVPKVHGSKSDKIDAFALAEQLRSGSMETRVYKGRGDLSKLATLGKTYRFITTDIVRVKNRLKSVFRSRGVATPGQEVYSRLKWGKYLEQLPESHEIQAELLLSELEHLTEIQKSAKKELLKEAQRFPRFHTLKTIPGLGDLRVAQMLPIVVTPYRFQNKRMFWAYCGFGVVMRTSADWERGPHGAWQKVKCQKTRGLNYNHNRIMKQIFKSAATTVIGLKSTSDPIYKHYCSLLENGTNPNLAKLTIARQLASIVLSLWRSGEEY
ncbi:transposase, partial [Patescibacteria group bacterium]|nr:transposase [Patescibacteria group bacterium]